MASKIHVDFHGNSLMIREVDGFILRETVHQPGVKLPKHSHERSHLAFVLRGLQLDEPVFINGGVPAWLAMRLYNEARQTDAASSLALEGLSLEILAELSRQRPVTSERKPPRWLEQAREIIHAKFAETLTHDHIADLVAVHPVHLANVFRRHYKCTIGEYVRRLRIEHACREISSSEASLVEIALASGFSDQSHFSKVFKKLAGMTPTEFRKNLRKP